MIGEPLTDEQYRNIQDWIPPPIIEENEHAGVLLSADRIASRIYPTGHDEIQGKN